MAAYKARDKAFTIVELLTVVTILALLVAMLTPYLSKAREITKRALCLSNQSHIAQAGLGFAASHGGHGPGGGLLVNDNIPNWSSSICWAEQLNNEYFRADVVQRGGCTPEKGKLYCPNMRYNAIIGAVGVRGHQWNMWAEGGPNWPGNPLQGWYGLSVDPCQVNYMYGSSRCSYYALGAQLSRFKRPDYQILIRESEAGDDSGGSFGNTSSVNGDYVTLNVENPPWCAGSSPSWFDYSFRHVLPPDPALYQEQATACYAFIDGHVDIVRPSMDINADARYAP